MRTDAGGQEALLDELHDRVWAWEAERWPVADTDAYPTVQWRGRPDPLANAADVGVAVACISSLAQLFTMREELGDRRGRREHHGTELTGESRRHRAKKVATNNTTLTSATKLHTLDRQVIDEVRTFGAIPFEEDAGKAARFLPVRSTTPILKSP